MAKRTDKKLIIGLVVAISLLLIAAVYKSKNKPKGEGVTVEKIEKRTIIEQVSASGKVFPETEVKISSDVSGEIVSLLVEEGDSVTSGQLLAKIDPDVYQSQVERQEATVSNMKAQLANSKAGIARAEAQLTQAKAQAEQIEAQIANSSTIFDRNKQLYADGIISDADYQSSVSDLDALKANLRSAQANVKSSEANLEGAKQSVEASRFQVKSAEASLKETRASLRRTNIYASSNGVISRLDVEQGERVVGTLQMEGTAMMRLANLDAMEVQVDVSEIDVLRVSVGDKTEIEVDAYLDRKFTGVVTEIANSATNSTAALTTDQVTNFVVKIRIDRDSYSDLISPQKRFAFRPGMSASVEINTKTVKDVLCVPIQAVTTREDKNDKNKEEKDRDVKEVVFLMNGDKAEMVEVTTGIQDDTYIQVLSGLEEGNDVVVGPYKAVSKKLKDGSTIRKEDKKDKEKKEEEDDEA